MTDIVQVYSSGLLFCSVCAPKEMTPKQVAENVNLYNPSGTTNGWEISPDKTFLQGGL